MYSWLCSRLPWVYTTCVSMKANAMLKQFGESTKTTCDHEPELNSRSKISWPKLHWQGYLQVTQEHRRISLWNGLTRWDAMRLLQAARNIFQEPWKRKCYRMRLVISRYSRTSSMRKCFRSPKVIQRWHMSSMLICCNESLDNMIETVNAWDALYQTNCELCKSRWVYGWYYGRSWYRSIVWIITSTIETWI